MTIGRHLTLDSFKDIVMYSYILLTHVLAATIWTGGHLVLALTILPRALRLRDPNILLAFEASFERTGMTALVVQVITGGWMAYTMKPDILGWFSFADFPSRLIMYKLGLLLATLIVAMDARYRVIPHLNTATLPVMARRVVLVTLLSVGFVIVGVSLRGGLLA